MDRGAWRAQSVGLQRVGPHWALTCSHTHVFKHVLCPLYSFFYFRDPILWIVVCLVLFQRSLKLSSCLFYFFLFSALLQWFPLLCLPAHWSISVYHQINSLFLLVYLKNFSAVSFRAVWFFFISSQPLLNFFLCSSYLLLNSLSMFPNIILNSLVGRLTISTSLSSSSGVLSCSFLWGLILASLRFLFLCVCWVGHVSWPWISDIS